VLALGVPELLMLALWGVSMVAFLSGGAMVKGMIAGGLGLLLGGVGADPQAGYPRWDLGTLYLLDGIPLGVVGMGIFAIPELVSMAVTRTQIADAPPLTNLIRGQWEGAKDAFRNMGTIVRGGIMGALVTAIPGVGGSAIGWMAYGLTVRSAKDKSRFGKGDVRGVIGPDSAANAQDGGNLIPTLAFAIPGSTGMAFLLIVLWAHGVQPGPDLLTTQLNVTYFMIWGLVVANVIGAAICFLAAGQLAKVCYVPYSFLFAILIPLMFISAYQVSGQIGDIILLLILGLLGYIMKQFGWPRAPLMLGFVLTNTVEVNLRVSTVLYGASWLYRPIVLVLWLIILLGLLFPLLKPLLSRVGSPKPARRWSPARESWLFTSPLLKTLLIPLLSHVVSPQLLGDVPQAPASGSAEGGVRKSASVGRAAAPGLQVRLRRLLTPDALFALFLLGVLTVALLEASIWPAGPKRYPLAIGIATVVLLAIHVLGIVGGKASTQGNRVIFDVPADVLDIPGLARKRAVSAFAWLTGLLASVFTLGLWVSLPLFTLLYLRLVGRAHWKVALVCMALVGLVEWGLFDRLVGLFWYPGLLRDWLNAVLYS
jgi:TctA family transporter